MRALLPALLLLALALPAAPASAQATTTRATLTIDVGEDRTEAMALRFEGLRRLTEYQDICLPLNATPTRVHDDLGDVPHTRKTEPDGRVTITFRARGETAAVLMERPAPPDEHAPFHEADANFCVPEGARSTVRVRVPEGHELFFISRGGVVEAGGAEATLARQGPVHVFYAYEAPLDPGLALAAVESGPFRVVAPASMAAQAREVAQTAAPALRRAMEEAGLPLPWDRLRVRYAPATEFSWEAGHYGGHGLITIRESSLGGSAREGYPYVPARVLVHEAFHAVSAPYGKGPVTDVVDWWLEGAARHAESHVDAVLPNGSRHCEKSAREVRCWTFDDRVAPADLEEAYASSFSFERRWAPSLEQSAETRSFYYRYAAYLVGAYLRLHGVDAYRAAWDDLQAAFAEGEGCPCGDGWLETALLGRAPGATARDLYRPQADLRFRDPAAFDAWAKPLLKDEKALQDELDRQAGRGAFPGLDVPGVAAPLAALALLGGALLARRRRPRLPPT